jgi:hypothetical protein
MADQQTLQLDQNGVMTPQDLSTLLNQTKMGLVSQFPYLANNPQFQSELNDAFSNFSSRGVQTGSDYGALYNQIIQPFVAKWRVKGAQDTAKLWENQELGAIKVAKETGSPTAAIQQYPQLISPKSPYQKQWTAQMQKEDVTSGAQPKMNLGQRDHHNELVSAVKAAESNLNSANTPENQNTLMTAQKALDAFDSTVGPVMRQGTPVLQPSPSPTQAPGAAPQPYQPVAAPMGTSGYVTPGLTSNGSTFIGTPTPQQAAQLLNQWNSRVAGPTFAPASPPAPPAAPNPNAVAPVGASAGPKPALLPAGFGQVGASLQPPAVVRTPSLTKEDVLAGMGLKLDSSGKLQATANLNPAQGGDVSYGPAAWGEGKTVSDRIALAQKVLSNPNIPWKTPPKAAAQAPPTAQPTNAATGRVTVKSPDGTVGTIPTTQLQEALSNGYTQVQ